MINKQTSSEEAARFCVTKLYKSSFIKYPGLSVTIKRYLLNISTMCKVKEICAIFVLLLVQVEMQKLGRHNFTSEWSVVTRDTLWVPLVTEMNNSLVYVSFPTDFTIRLETFKAVNKPCEVPIALIKEHRGRNVVPVYAETLGNGKIIVSLFESKKEANQSNVWLHVINPQKCTQTYDKFRLDASIARARDVMAIVTYGDSFDIFMRSDIHCAPNSICSMRYNDKLMLVESKKSVLPFDGDGWDINTLKMYDFSEGFLYIVIKPATNTTLMKRLNANLELIQKTELNHSGSVAYWYDEDGSASMCFGVSDQEIECILLDSQMQIKYNETLYYDYFVQYYSIFRLENSDAIVLTILSNDPEGSDSATYVQYVRSNGKVSSPVKFQENICENVYEMNTFKVEERLFCASTMCRHLVNTKCIGPTEDREF